MARKYDYTYAGNKTGFGWGMERCEERLLWAAYCEIEQRLGPEQQPQKNEFLEAFFDSGLGVKVDHVAWINSSRRRQSLEPVEFKETNVYDYARNTDRSLKAEMRRQMKTEFFGLDTAGQVRWKHQAEEEIARLPAPHHTWDEMRASRTRASPSLTPRERAVRLRVVDQVQAVTESQPEEEAPDVGKQNAAVAKALRQLKLARKSETISKIVAQLQPDDALLLAETGEIDDADLVDALVARSLEEAA
jgi:hypothetical protein